MKLYWHLFTAIFLAFWSLMVVSCGGTSDIAVPKQQEINQKQNERKLIQDLNNVKNKKGDENIINDIRNQEIPADPRWAPPNKAIRLGDLQIKITKLIIGKVHIKDTINENAFSENDLLLIRLDLLNTNPTKKIDYNSWSGKLFSITRDFATLKDNFGNFYKRIGFGLGSYPVGSVERSASIYPNKSIIDVLVFEVPLDTAKYLDLELPATNYDSEGAIRFRIPIKSIRLEKEERQFLAEKQAMQDAKKRADDEENKRAIDMDAAKRRADDEENKRAIDMDAAKRRAAQLEAQKKAEAQDRLDSANAAAEKMLAELIKTRVIYRQAKEDSPNRALAKPALVRLRKALEIIVDDGFADPTIREKISAALREKD